jgi:hypothetical protein
MNYIVMISVATYLVMSLMAFQIIKACKHEIQEVSKRYRYHENYSAI